MTFPNIQNWQDTLAAKTRWVFLYGAAPTAYADIQAAFAEYDALRDTDRDTWRRTAVYAYREGCER